MGHSKSNSANTIEEAAKSTRVREKTLYYLGIEPPLPSQLFRALAGAPIRLRGFNNAADMVRASTQYPADMLLLDPTRLPDELTPIKLLTRMEMRSGIRPVLFCLAKTPDIELQINALHENAAATFAIPANAPDIAAKLKEVAATLSFDPSHVVVVDEHAPRIVDHELLAKPLERPRLIATEKHGIARTRSIRAAHELGEPPQLPATSTYPHHFLVRLEHAIADDRFPSRGSGLFYINISATGHNIVTDNTIAADSIRASVGTLVHDHLGPGDFVERLGAFNYAIYANRTNDIELRKSAEDLLNTLNQHAVELGQQKILIKASIGISYVRPLGDDAQTLISRACTACAKAARAGDGEAHVSGLAAPPLEIAPSQLTASLHNIEPEEGRIATLIRAALDGDDFQLLYQPVLKLRENQSSRHEVQLRMKTPDGELISPLNFIPVAERFGWMEEIDRWVMLHALKTLEQQRGRGCKLRFFIHQTAASLQSKEWVLWLRDQIVRRDLIDLRPVLQFRSDEVLVDSETAIAHLRILKRLGISVCLINITGENDQLELFKRLPTRMIAKLAVSHVANSETQALTKLVHELHRLDARVFATGIENYQTVGRVWNCGFDFIQGNFIQFPHVDPECDASAFVVE